MSRRQTKVAFLASIVTVAGCSVSNPASTINMVKGDVHQGFQSSKGDLVKRPSYSYQIDGYKLTSSDNDLQSFELDGVKIPFKSQQISVELTDEKHLGEVAAFLNASVLEQEELWGPPTILAHDDGSADITYSNTKIRRPLYLLSVPFNPSESLDDLPEVAERAGVRGRHSYPNKAVAHLSKKLFQLNTEFTNKVKLASFNTVSTGTAATLEGGLVPSGGSESCPNLGNFWYAQNYYTNSNAKGANINDTSANTKMSQYSLGDGVRVAIVDGGFLGATEPRIPSSIVYRSQLCYNSASNSTGYSAIAGATAAPGTYAWHGREMAGNVFAPENDAAGIVGTAPLAQPILLQTDYTDWNTRKCLDQGAIWSEKVVSISFGIASSSYYATWTKPAIDSAVNNNVIILCSAGNNGNQAFYPGAYANVLTVSAHGPTGALAQWGTQTANTLNVDIYAPGQNFAAATPPGQDSNKFIFSGVGTSGATSLVAGIAASAYWRGKVSNTSNTKTHLYNMGNSYTCGRAVDAIWSVR